MTETMMALATLEEAGALTKRGISLPPDITLERYIGVLRLLAEAGDKVQWATGDAFSFGEEVFPDEHSQAWDDAGIDTHRAMQYIRVSRAIPPLERTHDLHWSYYRAVYTLDRETRDHWLLRCVNEGWNRDRLQEELAIARGSSGESNGLPAPSRTYVLERVSTAAENVYRAAHRLDDVYVVPVLEFEQMAEALGVDLT